MVMLCEGRIEAQSLVNPRAISLGAYSPLVSDTREFGANSSGLTGLTDWYFSATTYLPTGSEVDGFVFHGLTLGKRFLDRHAAAMQFSNGSRLEIVFPAEVIIVGSDPTTVDTRLSYSEQFSLGYALRLTDQVAAGVSARFREETLTDTQYQLAESLIVRLPDRVHSSTSWLFDLSFMWSPGRHLSTSLVARNLISAGGEGLPDEYADYQLDDDPVVALGVAYSIRPDLLASVQGGTDKAGALGAEFLPGSGWALRGSIYFNEVESPFFYAFGTGVGWSYDFLQFDLSYLHFFNDERRSGVIDPGTFDPSLITNLDLNPYTPDRLSLSVAAQFGTEYVSQARIDGVEIDDAIFPVEREVYAYRPIGTAVVTNTSDQALNMKASFFVDRLMDEPTQSQPVYVIPGEQARIPLTAVFNEQLNELESTTIRDASVVVSSAAPGDPDDEFRQRIVVHGRNAWNGSVESLRYFVTPDDPSVIRYTRDVLLENRARLSENGQKDNLEKAMILFDTFAGKLLYVGDPRQSADHVQYPAETLRLRSGDCDDMTVCFSSLLNSVGISTAFVDVVPPDNPSASHVYLLFDTGVDPRNGSTISDNPKRYVIRSGAHGEETIWIPIETTVLADGFEAAWETGAAEFFEDVEINLGLVKGWVRIVDVY
jgi:transglutaminase-like putative cysteine protease